MISCVKGTYLTTDAKVRWVSEVLLVVLRSTNDNDDDNNDNECTTIE